MILTTVRLERPEGTVLLTGIAVQIEQASDLERLELDGARPYRKGPESPSASAGGGMALAPCRFLAPVREGSWSTLPTESWWGVPTPVGNSTSGPWDSVRAARRLHNSPGL
ncbi:MAG TPA: hypothetical protein VF916_12665, partial [Ktedonobacterales bacterium]